MSLEAPLALLANNPGIVPPNLGLSEAVADQKALDQPRPRFALLQQLAEKADDTEMALGSDIITTAFEGYRLLSVSGRGEALKNARRELSRRFSRTRREQEETTAA